MANENLVNSTWITDRSSLDIVITVKDIEEDNEYVLPNMYIRSIQLETDVNDFIATIGIRYQGQTRSLTEALNASGNTFINIVVEDLSDENVKTSFDLDFLVDKHETESATTKDSNMVLSLVSMDWLALDNYSAYTSHNSTDTKKIATIKSLFTKVGLSAITESTSLDETTIQYISSTIHSTKDSIEYVLGNTVSKNYGYYNIRFDHIANNYVIHSPKSLKESITGSADIGDIVPDYNFLSMPDELNTNLEANNQLLTIKTYEDENVIGARGILNKLKTINAREYNHVTRKWSKTTFDSAWIHSALPTSKINTFETNLATKNQSNLINGKVKAAGINNVKDIVPRQNFELYDSVKELHELTKVVKITCPGHIERKAGEILIITRDAEVESPDSKSGIYYVLKDIKYIDRDDFTDILYVAKLDNFTGYRK